MTYWNQKAYDDALDAGLPEHERVAIATAPAHYDWETLPPMPVECACGATGDEIDDPIYVGSCRECGEETCARCGLVEPDVDGNMHTCKKCLEEA